ncbi:15272_t:CDS:1, partial [Gigaspora rosea]
ADELAKLGTTGVNMVNPRWPWTSINKIDLSWKNLRIDDPSRAFVTQLIFNILETE